MMVTFVHGIITMWMFLFPVRIMTSSLSSLTSQPALFIAATCYCRSSRPTGSDFPGATQIFRQKPSDVPESSTGRWAEGTRLRDFSILECSSASPVGVT